MAKEIENKGYYKDYLKKKWIDIHQSVKICVETWLANLLFEGDMTRVIYSAPDISFRRRIELLDTGKTEDTEYTPISLNLPYASFFQTSDWEDDDRFAAKQTGQMITGDYDMTVYRHIRSRAVKSTYTVQILVARRDDVRAMAQLISWEASPKGPILLYHTAEWKGNKINIPIFTTIEKIDTKPSYNEKDFLEKTRMFPIEVTLTVRSYEVLIGNVNNVIDLPIRFNQPEEDDTIYITKQAELEFAAKKFDLDTDTSKVDTTDEDLNASASKYFTKEGPFTNEELRAAAASMQNATTTDILKGYYTESTEVDLSSYKYIEAKSTPTSAYLQFKIKPADYKYFERMVIVVPGHDDVQVTDCKQTCVTIDSLCPNSTYKCKILTYSTSGEITTFNLTFTTAVDPNDAAPTPAKINKVPGLVGMHI